MELTFICLNLWYGGKLFDEILAFLREENADVLALQEVYNGQESALPRQYRSFDVLGKTLGYPHRAFAPAFYDHRADGTMDQGNAILSRFPILSTSTRFYDNPYDHEYVESGPDFSPTPRNILHCVIDANGTDVHVFDTQGIWGFDGEDNERRLSMADVIVDEVSGKEPAILAGDFNVKEQTQTIQNIERPLKSVFKGELKTSFNLRHKKGGGFATAVVDMVFVSPDVRVIDHRTSHANVSDHIPLVCRFSIGNAGATEKRVS